LASCPVMMITPVRPALTLQSQDDGQLAALAQDGDIAAFEVLVRRWQIPLLRFLRRRVNNRDDAEDLFQETMLRAYRGLATYNPARPFRPWVFTIAWRLAANHRRDRRGSEAMPAEQSAVWQADEALAPDRQAESKDQRESLWALAAIALSEEQVTMLWLFYVEALTAREISQVTGRSWIAVKTALSRARARLHKAIQRRSVSTCPRSATHRILGITRFTSKAGDT
jgi:RNA polymerase sigma-70 factor, ECF subfamily